MVNSIWINILLCVFNMLPLPPLDGGRVAVAVLPARLAIPLARLERWGIMIILIALFVLPWLGSALGMNLNVFGWLILGPAEALMSAVTGLVGVDIGR